MTASMNSLNAWDRPPRELLEEAYVAQRIWTRSVMQWSPPRRFTYVTALEAQVPGGVARRLAALSVWPWLQPGSVSDIDLVLEDGGLGRSKALGGRRVCHRAVLDRILTAVAIAVNDAVADGCNRASLVRADLAESLVFALAWLGDHVIGVLQYDSAADRHLRGCDTWAFRGLSRRR